MPLDLKGVVTFDRDDELAQQLEELCGGGIGEPRQEQRQQHGDAVPHVSSSKAVAMCSVLICRVFAAAAAESA